MFKVFYSYEYDVTMLSPPLDQDVLKNKKL